VSRAGALAALLALWPVALAAQRAETAPLAAYLGRWHGVGTSHATKYSPAGSSTADVECRWSAGGRFLACDMQILAGTDSIEQLSAYAPADSGRFALYAVTPGGRPAYFSRVTIAGNTWTYASPNAPAAGPRWRTVNEWVTPGEMHWRTEYTEDGEHWTTTIEGVSTRIG